mmetsp:Transcript_5393/g.17062  ORF Transcript_5393/g.17062 Transcript_5393/m.17062 type:complete len:216 (+) Transcript_5393:599-1246(+)
MVWNMNSQKILCSLSSRSCTRSRKVDTDAQKFLGSGVFMVVIFSFFCGFLLSRVGMQFGTSCDYNDNINENELNGTDFTESDENSRVFGEDNSLQALAFRSASASFSCNVEGALENLAKLHTRRVNLEKKRKRGEANRARTANLERKTGEAISAERAMRSCMESVIPEVLHAWDAQLPRNQKLGQTWWTDTKESDLKESGINIRTLERTAEDLEG